MNGSEIITFLNDNFPTIMGAVGPVAGAIFTAIFLRNNTATAEFEKIKAGQFKEVANDLLESGKMTYTEYYKANNFLSVAKKADDYYSEMYQDNVNTEYNFDWFMRFYEAVGNISDKTMQELWAKILAGEIAEPNSFSLRTIDVLRNISKKDAELFVKVCSHSFIQGQHRLFLPNYNKCLEKCNIRYIDIMKLNEIDPKYWEHYFSMFIEPLYGIPLENIIAKITLSNSGKNILDTDDKKVLSKIICFQYQRIPAYLDHHLKNGVQFGKQLREAVFQTYKDYLPATQIDRITNMQIDDTVMKEFAFEAITDSDKIEKYVDIMIQRIWTVNYNNTELPFFTSDNPVLMYNLRSRSVGYSDNGIARSDTIIFFPCFV